MRTAEKMKFAGALIAAAAVVVAPAEAAAQQPGAPTAFQGGTYVSAGYVVNAPEQMLGFGVMTVGDMWGGWGLYADAKRSTDSPGGLDSFDPNRTAADVPVADELFQEQNAWRSLNAAVVRSIGSQLAVYAGGGVYEKTAYDEYRSDELQGTADAFYWVEDEAASETGARLIGGAIFRATRYLIFQFGAETNPAGATVGAGLALPLD